MQSDTFVEEYQQESNTHLRDYFCIILNRKWSVVTVLTITLLLSGLSTYSKIPIYTASTEVLIEKNMDGGNIEGLRLYMMWDPAFRLTQIELIKSINVAHRVVENLQLDTKYRKFYFKKNPKTTFSPVNAIRNSLSALITRLFPAKAVPEPPSQEPELSLQTEPHSDAYTIASMISGGLSIEQLPNTNIVTIKYSHESPAIARLVVNGVVQAYIEETIDIKTSSTRKTIKWMTSKAKQEQYTLEESEKALQQYMRDHDIVTVENKLAIYPEKLEVYSSQLITAQAKERGFKAILDQINSAGNDQQALERIPIVANNAILQNLRNQIFNAQQNIRELSKQYGHKHPVLIEAEAEQADLLREKKVEISRIIDSTRKAFELVQINAQNAIGLRDAAKEDMLKMNGLLVQYTLLNREKEMNQTVYNALSTTIKKTNVTAQTQDIKIWAIRKADLPETPSKPNKKEELLRGLLIGLIGGILLVFGLEYLDNTAKSGQVIEDRYNLTVLGSVEDLSGKSNSIDTYIKDHPLSPLAESYRLIRSSILFSSPDHPPRAILLTSMVQQEGKTTTTTNLAHMLAQNDKNVVIIDCDMRRPRQHSLFGIDNTYGLSNYLSGNTDETNTLIHSIHDESISLITSGPNPPNPAELLSSKRMGMIVEDLKEKYDFVLLDSPPVQQVTDSLMLTSIVDGTVIVIKAGKTTYDVLDSGIKKLRESHANLLGVILNRLHTKKAGKGYYGYYGYYSYYRKGDHYTHTNRDKG